MSAKFQVCAMTGLGWASKISKKYRYIDKKKYRKKLPSPNKKIHFPYSVVGVCGKNFRRLLWLVWAGWESDRQIEDRNIYRQIPVNKGIIYPISVVAVIEKSYFYPKKLDRGPINRSKVHTILQIMSHQLYHLQVA